MDAIESGSLLQTVDQQAYLQGFDTLMQLFLYNISGGLMAPTDTNTGTAIVVKATVGSYLKSNRWEGTADKESGGHSPQADSVLIGGKRDRRRSPERWPTQ